MRSFWVSALASFWVSAMGYIFVGFVLWDWLWLGDIATWPPFVRAALLAVSLGLCIGSSVIAGLIVDSHYKKTVKRNGKAKADYVRR